MRVWWDEVLKLTRDVFAQDQGELPRAVACESFPFGLESLGQQQRELPEPFSVLFNLGHSESGGCWLSSYLRVSNTSYGRRRIKIPVSKFLVLKEVSVEPSCKGRVWPFPPHLDLFPEAAALRYLNSKSLLCQRDLLQCGVMFRASQGGQTVYITWNLHSTSVSVTKDILIVHVRNCNIPCDGFDKQVGYLGFSCYLYPA